MDIGLKNIGEAFFKPLSARNSSVGAPLSVTLDTGEYGGRTNVEVWVKTSGSSVDFTVSGSDDGVKYRLTDTITLSAPGEDHRGYGNAYRYVRVETTAIANNEIEIVASR